MGEDRDCHLTEGEELCKLNENWGIDHFNEKWRKGITFTASLIEKAALWREIKVMEKSLFALRIQSMCTFLSCWNHKIIIIWLSWTIATVDYWQSLNMYDVHISCKFAKSLFSVVISVTSIKSGSRECSCTTIKLISVFTLLPFLVFAF